MHSTQAQKSCYYKTRSTALTLVARHQTYNETHSDEVKSKGMHLNICFELHETLSLSGVSLSAQGAYLVEQPHEQHGQAGVQHVVEGDEPVFICNL